MAPQKNEGLGPADGPLSKGLAAETRVPSSDLQHLVKGGCSALGGLPGSLEAAVTSLSVNSQWALGYLRYDFGVSTEFLLSLHAHIKCQCLGWQRGT